MKNIELLLFQRTGVMDLTEEGLARHKSLQKSLSLQRERERGGLSSMYLSAVVHWYIRERERERRVVGGKQLFNLAFSYGIRMEFNKVKLSLFYFLIKFQ